MVSQWQCIRPNIGTWYGSFMQFSSDGKLVKDTPSVLTLAETELGKTMTLTLVRSPASEPEKVNNLTFTAPGPAPYVYFFENGAFAQGSSQWSSFGQFGTEFSLKVSEDQRVRYVIMYEGTPSYTSRIKYVTLICETGTEGKKFSASNMTTQQLFGQWKGTVEVLNNGGALEQRGSSEWTFGEDLQLFCQEALEKGKQSLSVAAQLEETENNVVALKGTDSTELDYQLMNLPNGAYCLLPQEIKKDCAFRIEVGWKSVEGVRARFIRYYDTRGVWTRSALIEDRLQNNR